MNATIKGFGYPGTLVVEWRHWLALLRPAQPTAGSLVLAAKHDATAFGDLPEAAHAELKTASQAIETVLRGAIGYDRINYLMLMMVDPHVHFHVLPRYAGERAVAGLAIADRGWPGQPVLADAHVLAAEERDRLAGLLRERFADLARSGTPRS